MLNGFCGQAGHMELKERPEQATSPRRRLGYPVSLLCDKCIRVQDSLSEQTGEEEWTNQSRYFTMRNLNPSLIWWCHTVCRECSRNMV